MAEEKTRILAVSAAHRKNRNTAYMLKVALEAAEEMGGVETEFLELWGKKIKYCIHCDKCLVEPFRCIVKDDMQEIYPILERADAIIFGVPVFIMGVTGLYRNFMDRLRLYVHSGAFLWKVGDGFLGIIVFGGIKTHAVFDGFIGVHFGGNAQGEVLHVVLLVGRFDLLNGAV